MTQKNIKEIREHAQRMIKELDIRCTSSAQPVGTLSGGNQQKVCVARALALNPKFLFVSEPTRGIDIGAKKLVLETLARLNREQGLTVAEKPSAPCLATRLPYGECIVPGLLERIHELETQIKALTGIAVLRARIHWDTVRLEVLPESFPEALKWREAIIKAAKKLAFSRITLDLEGFRSGSFDI